MIAMMEVTDGRHTQKSCRMGLSPVAKTGGRRIFVPGVRDAIFVVVVLSNEPPPRG